MVRDVAEEVAAPPSFAARLREQRLAVGLTQAALAERAGLSTRAIQHLEAGLGAPYSESARRLADALELGESDRDQLLQLARLGSRHSAQRRPPVAREQRRFRSELPVGLNSFIGRTHDMEVVGSLLDRARWVTLIGPGGVGKTRLATAVARARSLRFADGVCLVPLAALREHTQVLEAVARALGLAETGPGSVRQHLHEDLANCEILLVLDNFEHVQAAAPEIIDLLSACPHLKVLVTSRARLRVRGERVHYVRPLTLPREQTPSTPEQLLEAEAVALFVDRAQEIDPSFELTADNASAVTKICRRLDGIPLALEIAAARTRVLTPDALLARLSNRFAVLVGDTLDAPRRHQTLRSTIDWSYQLLSESERRLCMRLAVFAGGWSLEAAEFVGAGEGVESHEVLGLLERLIDSSLVQVEPTSGSMRCRLLETIHQFSYEQLCTVGQADLQACRRRHAQFFLDDVERGQHEMTGKRQARWVAHLEREHDNLRAALDWAVGPDGDAELALRLAAGLWRFWYIRGYLSEGSHWLDTVRILPMDTRAENIATRAAVMNGAAVLAGVQGDFERARSLLLEALRILQDLRDRGGAARALLNLGNLALIQGEYETADRLLSESIALRRELEDVRGIARSLNSLAVLARERGQPELMSAMTDEALDLSQRAGDPEGIALSLVGKAIAATMHDRHADAVALLKQSLRLSADLGDRRHVVECIELLAGQESALGQPTRAARLFGAAEAILESSALVPLGGDRFGYADNVECVRSALGEADFAHKWAQGRTLPFDRAVRDALEVA